MSAALPRLDVFFGALGSTYVANHKERVSRMISGKIELDVGVHDREILLLLLLLLMTM